MSHVSIPIEEYLELVNSRENLEQAKESLELLWCLGLLAGMSKMTEEEYLDFKNSSIDKIFKKLNDTGD